MNHKHHLVPRHQGGSDDPSNLYECSVETHAELHLSLYLDHGRQEDWDAFMGLSGQLGKEELIRRSSSRGGSHPLTQESKERISRSHQGKPKHTPESKELISKSKRGKSLSQDHKDKISQSCKGNKNSLGHKQTEETKDKVSKSLTGNSRAKGSKRTEEQKRVMSERKKLYWEEWRKNNKKN